MKRAAVHSPGSFRGAKLIVTLPAAGVSAKSGTPILPDKQMGRWE